MKIILFTTIFALASSPLMHAQTTPLSIIATSNPNSDYNFFDIYKLNVNSGEVHKVAKHYQAFNAMIHCPKFKLKESEELIIQFRDRDRSLIDEFSCRARYHEDRPYIAELIVIDPAEGFAVSTGMSLGDAIMAGADY